MDRIIENKKPKRIRLVLIAVFFAAIFIFTYRALNASEPSKLVIPADSLRFSRVSVGEFQEYIPINGIVQAEKTLFVDLAASGIVESIAVKNGSQVKKGDLLLTLSNAKIQKENIDSESMLLENLNMLRNSSIALTEKKLLVKEDILDIDYEIETLSKRINTNKLSDTNSTNDLEYQEMRRKLDHLQEKRVLATEKATLVNKLYESQMKQIDDAIERVNMSMALLAKVKDSLYVRATGNGVLSSMNAEVGQSFEVGQRVGQVDVLDDFKVSANIDEYYISRVKIGQKGKFQFNDKTYLLEVVKIYPEIVNNTFKIDFTFPNYETDIIKRGQTLQIDLALENSSESKFTSKAGFYNHTNGR